MVFRHDIIGVYEVYICRLSAFITRHKSVQSVATDAIEKITLLLNKNFN